MTDKELAMKALQNTESFLVIAIDKDGGIQCCIDGFTVNQILGHLEILKVTLINNAPAAMTRGKQLEVHEIEEIT